MKTIRGYCIPQYSMHYYLIGPSRSAATIQAFSEVVDIGKWGCIHPWWHHLDRDDPLEAAREDLRALSRADLVVVWADRHFATSKGAHFELGVAHAYAKPIWWIEWRPRRSRAKTPDVFADLAKRDAQVFLPDTDPVSFATPFGNLLSKQ